MSKSELKRKSIQHNMNDELMQAYEKELVGCWIDPPTGWRYGFPDVYDGKLPFREWIKSKGYPMKDWDDWARNYVRVWKDTP